jgi:hypothetical protein
MYKVLRIFFSWCIFTTYFLDQYITKSKQGKIFRYLIQKTDRCTAPNILSLGSHIHCKFGSILDGRKSVVYCNVFPTPRLLNVMLSCMYEHC